MEKAIVAALLEKYWQAETTIEEEQALAAYFQGNEVDPELEAFAGLFSYFQEEARVSAGPDFGDRILRQLGLLLDAPGIPDASDAPTVLDASDAQAVPAVPAPVVPMAGKPFGLAMAAAAAAIVLVVAGLFLLKPAGGPAVLADVHPAARTTPGIAETPDGRSDGQVTRTPDRARVTDTYDDPQQALAAVRHALLIASHHLNQGRRELTGDRK